MRTPPRGPGPWGFLLAHHGIQTLDRCYRLGKARPLWLCARCLGLYPILIASLILLLRYPVPRGVWDLAWLYLTPVPALVDWSLSRLGVSRGRNWLRTLTGALLGLGLGRMLALHLVDPYNRLVLPQWGGMVVIWAAVELLARLRGRFHQDTVGGGP